MNEVKYILHNYQMSIIVISILLITLLLYSIYKNKDHLLNFKIFSIIMILFFVISIPRTVLNNISLFKKGDCFMMETIINDQPTEKWHKEFETKIIEYLVLKVGNNNYLVSTSKPSLEDFPFNIDYKGKKSECKIIYNNPNI